MHVYMHIVYTVLCNESMTHNLENTRFIQNRTTSINDKVSLCVRHLSNWKLLGVNLWITGLNNIHQLLPQYKSFIFCKLEILNDCMQSGLIDWHRYVTHFLLSEVMISVGKETSVQQANVEKTANIAVSRAMTVTSRFSGYISFARPHTAINVHWTYTQIYVRLFQTNIVLQSHATHTEVTK